MATSFELQTTERGGVRILALRGYLDAHTAPLFEDAIQAEVDNGAVRLIADCTHLDYISSAGLGVFMSFIEEIRDRGGDLKLASIQPKVYQVFDVLGFPALFDISASVDLAVARFEEGA